MSELDELRVKVAEARGWKDCHRGIIENRASSVGTLDGVRKFIPDYPCDLNAMHEAEKLLSDSQYERFSVELWALVNGSQPRQARHPIRCDRAFLSATAYHRARAFIQVMT